MSVNFSALRIVKAPLVFQKPAVLRDQDFPFSMVLFPDVYRYRLGAQAVAVGVRGIGYNA